MKFQKKVGYRFLVICVLFVSACTYNTNNDSKLIPPNSIIIEESDFKSVNYKSANILENYYYIPLETSIMQNLIGKIDKILLYKDRIFILDRNVSKSLLIFSNKGKYLKKINNIGDGPGEFKEPLDFTINPDLDQIVMYDNKNRKLLFFDLEAKFINEDKLGLNFRSIINFDSKYFIFTHSVYNYLDKYGELPYDLLVLNNKNEVLGKQFQNNAKLGVGVVVVTHNDYFTINNNKLFVSIPLNDTIYKISESNTAIPFCYFDFGKYSIPEQNKINNKQIELYKDVVMDGLYSARYGPLKCANKKFITSIAYNTNSKKTNKFCYVLFSDDLKTKKVFNKIEFEDDAIFNFPKTSYGDYFVSVIYPEEILANKEINNDNTEIKLKGINTKINKFDNPILMFTKFK